MADRDIIGYELTVDIAGPEVRDRIAVTAETIAELEPEIVDVQGYSFERYNEDQGYVEIRRDYVISRRLVTLTRDDPPNDRDHMAPPEAGDSGVHIDGGPQAEERQR